MSLNRHPVSMYTILCCGCLLLGMLTFSDRVNAETPGADLFDHCVACHMQTGEGVLGLFPPLVGRLGALTTFQQGRDYLVLVVAIGLTGHLQIKGIAYQGTMPAQGPRLGEAGIQSRYPEVTIKAISNLRQVVFSESEAGGK